MAGLVTPRLEILLAPHPDAVPGVDEPIAHEVQVLNKDLVEWDKERVRHKWPEMAQAPALWATYVAWRAGQRDGFAKDMTLPQFEAAAWQVKLADDSTVDDEVDPTLRDPGPG